MMSKKYLFIPFVLLGISFFGCTSSEQNELEKEAILEKESFPITEEKNISLNEIKVSEVKEEKFTTDLKKFLPQTISAPVRFTEPRLTGGDVIRIDVAGEPDLSREFAIPNEGVIYFPLIKRIAVQKRTLKELSQEITEKLSSYLVDPIVNVSAIRWAERKVYVYGSQKGSETVSLPINEIMTASRLLITIGIPEDVDLSEVDLSRKTPEGKKVIIKIPLQDILEDYNSDKDVVLQPGDFISLKKSAKVYVQGSVKAPGAYSINQNKKMSLWALISLAKGPSEEADMTQIKIIREAGEGQRKVLLASATPAAKPFYLEANDIIIIPSQRENLVTIYGEVNRPGTLKLNSGKTSRLSTVIARAGGLTEFSSYTIRVFRYLKDGSTKKLSVDFSSITSGDAKNDIVIQPGDVIYIDSSIF